MAMTRMISASVRAEGRRSGDVAVGRLGGGDLEVEQRLDVLGDLQRQWRALRVVQRIGLVGLEIARELEHLAAGVAGRREIGLEPVDQFHFLRGVQGLGRRCEVGVRVRDVGRDLGFDGLLDRGGVLEDVVCEDEREAAEQLHTKTDAAPGRRRSGVRSE
jgi:hypothetical protein